MYYQEKYNHFMVFRVELSRGAQKQLRKVPTYIATKLKAWVEAVETDGLEIVRRHPGYHDEPLVGQRQGQRSIRLSVHYRAIYVIHSDGTVEFVRVEEVTKHEY